MSCLPDMLYGAILRCPHIPMLRVKRVDISEAAEDARSSRRLSHGTDAGGRISSGLIYGARQDASFLIRTARYEGEEVAAVAAEIRPISASGWRCRSIRVEYEVLAIRRRMRGRLSNLGAAAIHERGNQSERGPRSISRGDVEKGFAEADVLTD